MPAIFHLAPTPDIHRAARKGEYAPASLNAEGFIHCSYAHQVAEIAAAEFGDSADLTLLEIDPERLGSRLVEEPNASGERFPHIYGPLAMSAVVSVRELSRGPDGRLSMPCTVTGNCTCK